MHQKLGCCEEDTTPPELSITSQELVYECTGLALGNAWVAPEVTAVDACEGPVPVHGFNTGDDDGDGIPGSIDPDDFGPGPTTETEGTTYVQYVAWDSHFNVAAAQLQVTVRDTLPPVLSLNGAEFVQTECFTPTDDPTEPDPFPEVDPDPFLDPGATATDQCYGDLTQQVIRSGDINKQIPGVYTLEYSVHDSGLHEAAPIIRNVEVVDTLPPKLQPLGPIQLSPADGGMRTVSLTECAIAWDLCEGYLPIDQRAYDLTLTSNDPGNDAGDLQIIDNATFAVRARNNLDGSPRIYTAQYKIADSSGNVLPGTCTVSIH